jgi:ribosome maturation factor RimP
MRRVLGLVGIAALVVLMTMTVGAQQKFVRGTVTAMAGDQLTVKVGAQDMTFTVDASTRLIGVGAGTAQRREEAQGKQGVPLAQLLKVGDGVEVHYQAKGAANYATTIRRGVQPTEAKEHPSGSSVSGVVKDVAGNTLTVTAEGKDMSFTVEPTTNVVGRGAGTLTKKKQEAGQKTVLTDFVGKGDDVIVNYTEKGGAMVATEVRVTRKAAK